MSRRAEMRRRARAACRAERTFPVVPGIIPENTEELRQLALAQAHEDLPSMLGTQVVVKVFPLDEGFDQLRSRGWSDGDLALLAAHEHMRGPDPHVLIAMRLPRDLDTTTEAPTDD